MLSVIDGVSRTDDGELRILAIDDSRTMLAILERTLLKLRDLQVETCVDPVQALEMCARFTYDLVFVDYVMPEMDGIAVVTRLRQLPAYRTIPIVMLTSEGDRDTRMNALTAGVNDFLNKPFDPFELRVRVTNMLALRTAQKQQETLFAYLTNDVAQALRDLAAREKEIIWRLALAAEARDGGTGSHVARVAAISQRLALVMGLGEARAELISLAAPLHDVGKIGIPDAILGKTDPLTPAEEKVMRQHVAHGVNILRDGQTELLKVAASIVSGHHERWDGSGYPAGLSGENIPIEARIVAVADVFDAICAARPYKPAHPFDKAFAEILAGAGTQFDPACVAAFKKLEGELRQMRNEAPLPSALSA